MELEVVWTKFAEDKLFNIFSYYKLKAGLKVAKKIVRKIVSDTIKLEKQPTIGAVEELLKNRQQEFRYLVSNNYKIVYYINYKTNTVVIANVFDTRQNLKKISDIPSF